MFLLTLLLVSIVSPIAVADEPVVSEQPAAEETEGYCLVLEIQGARNAEGLLRIAAFGDAEDFEHSRDPAVHVSLPVDPAGVSHRLCGLTPGRWGLAVFHDEDADMELDTLFGIPREGFGFSRNPRIIKGKPGFSDVDIQVVPGTADYPLTIRMNYLL